MKKLAALLLAALLLLAVSAVAEYVPATLASGRCTFEFPENYIIVNDDTIVEIMQSEKVTALLTQAGIDINNLKISGLELICDAEITGCLTVVRMKESSSRLSLRLNKRALDAQHVKRFSSLGVDREDMNPRGIFRVGSNTYYGFEFTYSGFSMGIYITVDDKGNQYSLIFAGFDPTLVNHVLETFAPSMSYTAYVSPSGLYSVDMPVGSSIAIGNDIFDLLYDEIPINALLPADEDTFYETFTGFDPNSGIVIQVLTAGSANAETTNKIRDAMDNGESIADALGIGFPFTSVRDAIIATEQTTWYGVEYKLLGMKGQNFYAKDDSGNEYLLVLTNVDADVVARILETFTFLP